MQGIARRIAWIVLPLLMLNAYGCALCLAGAAGGAAGYEMREHGYKVQSPVTKK